MSNPYQQQEPPSSTETPSPSNVDGAGVPPTTPGQAPYGTTNVPPTNQAYSGTQAGANVPPANWGYSTAQSGANVPPTMPTYPQQTTGSKGPDGCLIAVIASMVLAFMLGMFFVFGQVACSSSIATEDEAYQDIEDIIGKIAPGTLDEADEAEIGNATLRELLGKGSSADPFSKKELEQLQSSLFSKAEAKGSNTPQGIYFVGDGKNSIKAGQYWIGGADSGECYYFVLEKSSVIGNEYTSKLVNTFYGHNIAEVSDGQVLVVINGDEGFCPLSKMKKKFSDPYTNGVFRVGTDIPEGTYFLQPGKDPENKFAYYVMKDLSYEDDYITDQKEETEISAFTGCQVTVKNGEYLELFNATATKGTQG